MCTQSEKSPSYSWHSVNPPSYETSKTDCPDILKARFTRYSEKVVRNAKIDYIRRQNAIRKNECLHDSSDSVFDCPVEDDVTITPATSNLALLVNDERLSCILPKLKEREQQLILLVYIEDLSIEEAAKTLGMTKEATYKANHRLLKKLRTLIGE